MGVDLSAMDRAMPKAIRHFWKARRLAAASQTKRGTADQGNRSGVTAGKNLDGFIAMVRDIIVANGIAKSDVYCDVEWPAIESPGWGDLAVAPGDAKRSLGSSATSVPEPPCGAIEGEGESQSPHGAPNIMTSRKPRRHVG